MVVQNRCQNANCEEYSDYNPNPTAKSWSRLPISLLFLRFPLSTSLLPPFGFLLYLLFPILSSPSCPRTTASCSGCLRAGPAPFPIVLSAPFGLAKDIVGTIESLGLVQCFLGAGVEIWVILLYQPPIRLLYGLRARSLTTPREPRNSQCSHRLALLNQPYSRRPCPHRRPYASGRPSPYCLRFSFLRFYLYGLASRLDLARNPCRSTWGIGPSFRPGQSLRTVRGLCHARRKGRTRVERYRGPCRGAAPRATCRAAWSLSDSSSTPEAHSEERCNTCLWICRTSYRERPRSFFSHSTPEPPFLSPDLLPKH